MAATTLMPLLAQSFVDQASQTTFEMVRPAGGGGHVPSTPSPSRPMRSPKRVTPSPRARRMGVRESPRDMDGRPVTDIFSWSDQTLAERYQFVEEVGYGNWGSVWKVRPKLEGPDAKVQSVKLVHRSRNPTSSARVRALWTEFKCIRALRNAPHPNLIAFHAFVVSPSYGLIVMDFHPQLMPVALPESRAKVYLRQLLSAVEHLHAHGITHNDIKPSNILLSSKDLATGTPVLIDFGFAQQYSLSAPDRFLSSLSWGTPEYLSPERAKGLVHDERLSDVFALGVTMYEIVVGRTPFEKSEDETFLNREQLEVYYERTTTGKFYGDCILSNEFDSLIRQMVDPSVQLRMQSCATALRHRFFAHSPPSSARSPGTPSSYSTPLGTGAGRSLVQTPVSTTSSAQKKLKHASPRKTPKHDPKAFAIFQDPGAPSPAQTAGSVSPFSPRPLALANRASTSRSPTPETPPSKAAAAPAPAPVQPPQSLATSVKSPPPPSRIPVRRSDLASPTRPRGTPAGHKRFVSSPLTSPIRHGATADTRPRVVSQPLLSGFKVVEPAVDENKPHATAAAAGPPARSASLKSIKRKLPPAFSELDYVPALPKSPGVVGEDAEVLAGNLTGPTAGEGREGSSSEKGPSALVTPTDESAMFTSRSYTIEIGKAKLVDDGRDSPILSSELPRLRKSSKALATTLRKLSVKHVPRAPSAMSFAGLKQSLSGRRRSSLTDSTYDIVEAEKLDERNAVTLPLNLRTKTSNSAPSERARLASFSRRMQGVLDARKTVDPFMISPTSPLSASFSPSESSSTTSPLRSQPLQPTVLEPFSFNSTSSLSSSSPASTASPSKSIKISPPQRKSSLRAKSLADSLSSLASPLSSPSISQSEFKPGHRRIPTAIRNVPSVVLHESADDADFSESDYWRADTPAFERVASPPPPPRVVEPSRQLPTWVPEDLSSDEGSDADVDEPTIKLTGSPSRIKRKPSRTASIRTATKVSLTQTFQPSSTRSAPLAHASPSRPALLRSGTYESASGAGTVAGSSSGAASVSRPASPSLSALPFTNLHLRSDSQSTFNTLSSAASGTGRGSVKGLHKRSRSVLSFFSLMGGGGGLSDGKEGPRPSSRASNLSSLAWSTTSRVQGETVEEEADGRKKKKGGRLRKAMSRVFR